MRIDPLPIGLAIAAALLGMVLLAKNEEEGRLRDDLAVWQRCGEDVAERRPWADFSASCPPSLAEAVETGRRSIRCNEALEAGEVAHIRAECSADVQRIEADLHARRSEVASLEAALGQARTDQASAIDRAIARTRTEAERRHRAQAAVQAAPRDAGGLVVCDADCLRARQSTDADPPGR